MNFKKLLCFMFAAVLIISVFPLTVIADAVEIETDEYEIIVTCMSGSTPYTGSECTLSGYSYSDYDSSITITAEPGQNATTASARLVGTYDTKLSSTDFAAISPKYSKIVFIIENGMFTITDGTGPNDNPVPDNLVVTETVDYAEYALGTDITFRIAATNIYNEPKTITLLMNEGVSLEQSTFSNVYPGETVTTTASHTVTEEDVLNGKFTGVVFATVENVIKTAKATARCIAVQTALPATTSDISVLANDVNTNNAATVWYGGKPWRAIGYNGKGGASEYGAVTLLSSGVLGKTEFNLSNGSNNNYSESALKSTLDDLSNTIFSSEEAGAIRGRYLESGGYDGVRTDCIAGDPVSGAVLWPLSLKEMDSDLNPDLANPDGSDIWWLRSPGCRANSVAFVRDGDADIDGEGLLDLVRYGVRPAFRLNNHNVLFCSKAEGGKISPDGGELSKIEPYSGNEWKVTVIDGERNFKVTETEAECSPGKTVSLNYTDAETGTNEYISAVIKDKNGNYLYYGRLASPSSGTGKVDVAIPEDLTPGVYHLYVFNEQYNGDKATDVSSKASDVMLTVNKRDVTLKILAPDETISGDAEILILSSVDGDFSLSIDDISTTVKVKDHFCLFNAESIIPGDHQVTVSFSGNENYNPASESTSFNVSQYGTLFKVNASPSFEAATGETLTLTPASTDGNGHNTVLIYYGIPSAEMISRETQDSVCSSEALTEILNNAESLGIPSSANMLSAKSVNDSLELTLGEGLFTVGTHVVTAVFIGDGDCNSAMEVFLIKVLPSWVKLQNDLAKGGDIVLTEDVVCTDPTFGPLAVPQGITVSLDLNGHTIDRGLADSDSIENGQVIDVYGNLTITDSVGGGCIRGGNNKGFGGGVTVNTGSLTTEGVSFIGNHSVKSGGAIYGSEYNANITVTGGLFFENTAKHASAIHMSTGTTAVSGASFIRNSAKFGTVENTWDVCDNLTVKNCVFLGNTGIFEIISANGGNVIDYNWFGTMMTNCKNKPVISNISFYIWYFLDLERTLDEATGTYSLSAVPYLYNTTENNTYMPSEYLLPEITLDCTATGAAFEDDAAITLSQNGYTSAPFTVSPGDGKYEYTVGVTVPNSTSPESQTDEPISASLTFERTFDIDGSSNATYVPGTPIAITAYENVKGESEKEALPAKVLENAEVKITLDGSEYTCTADENGQITPDFNSFDNGKYDATFEIAGFKTLSGSVTVSKPKASVTNTPTEKKLIHTGASQALVTSGTASGGTMMYALGESSQTAPASGWSDKVPERSDVNVYYVWYKAAGDGTHVDSDAKCVTSLIVYKVSFKVVNGTWSDGTADEKLLPLSRYDNENLTLILTSSDLPAVGDKPGVSYMTGSWDKPADVTISADTVFTYTYAEDPAYVPDNAAGSVTLSGSVALSGRDLTDDDEFSFELSKNGSVLQTKTTDKTGNIDFDTINYGKDDVGTHIYTVKQTTTDIVGVTADSTEYTVTVTVSYKRGDANLTVVPSASYNSLDFTNTYTRQVPPEYSVPTDISAIYGQTLADVELPDGWIWDSDLSTSVGDAGYETFSATYTPADTVLYKPMTASLTVAVEKAAIEELKENEKAIPAGNLIEEPFAQPLVNAPESLPEGCEKVMYSTDGGASWSNEIPTAQNAGEYEIMMLYVGDGNHENVTEGPVKITITSALYGSIDNGELSYTKGSGKPLTAVFGQTGAEDASFEHYDYTDIDGVSLVNGKDSTASLGSTVIKIAPEFLEGLSVGRHTLTVHFTNGEASIEFKVLAANSDSPKSPQTSGNGSITLWVTLLFIASCGVAATLAFGKVKKVYHK